MAEFIISYVPTSFVITLVVLYSLVFPEPFSALIFLNYAFTAATVFLFSMLT